MATELAPSITAGHLPAELSSFVGREAELGRLAEVLSEERLLTLVGPGGVGKTRLALRVAAGVQDRYPDGIWLVDLAPLRDPEKVPQAVADVLEVREHSEQPWRSALASRLRSLRLLLILDTCEHLVGRCSELAAALVESCPSLHILATSRQPLQAAGEHTWRVSPLSLPGPTDADSTHLEASDAVRLFVARARSRAQRFTLTERNVALIATICGRLDGLPLALELVAARVESLDLADIATRLDAGLALRVRGSRTAPARQQTLAATLDWSYALLTAFEPVLFRRLAIFAAGWSLEAAKAVCSDKHLPAASIVPALDRLVSMSLVAHESADTGGRYRLLHTVHQYARARLTESHEVELLHWRHLAYLLKLAERVAPDWLDAAHAAVLEVEHDEIRAALAWALERHEAEVGLRLATATSVLWYLRGHYAEGRDWMERLLALPEAETAPASARACRLLGQLLLQEGDYLKANEWTEGALNVYKARGDGIGVAFCMYQLGTVAMWRGDLEQAGPLLAEAAQRLHAAGNPGEFGPLINSATVALERGDFNRALTLAVDIDTRGRDWQPQIAMAWALALRGLIAARSGRTAVAEALLHRAVELQRPLLYHQFLTTLRTELAHVLLDRGKLTRAKTLFAEALESAYAGGEHIRLVRALEGVARSISESTPHAAVRLAASAAAERVRLAAAPWPRDIWRSSSWLPDVRRKLGERVYEIAWASGEGLSMDDALSLARDPLAGQAADARAVSLTRREIEVAALLASGLSTRQISEKLVISRGTVRSHVDHVMAKLNLHSRTQVAVWGSEFFRGM
jgi:predicted ATPase/DNA-binding NarL/FixJ family response regulator